MKIPTIPLLSRTINTLQEGISYYGDLHIDAGTRKLILNLLRSIRSVVPVVNPPDPGFPDEDTKGQNLEYIGEVLALARQHAAELEGIFNPDELMRYADYARHYRELVHEMEATLEELKRCSRHSETFAAKMAEMVENHLGMTRPERRICRREDRTKLKIVG
jgi:hypothetical protein